MRILLVEDDEVLVNILLQCLTKQLYVVDTAKDGRIGWEYAVGANYDLILMDVELPKLDGISLCQKLRSQGCLTPILLMTAREASSDRIRGLDAGADDYLIKPLNLEELQARVRALLRRGEVPHTPVLEVGVLQLNPSSCQVTYAGKELVLTPKEYSLLELFMRNPSRVFSRGNIIEHLWTFDDPPQEETVKSHIKGLRQKLKVAGAVDWIENVYGLGYRINPKVVGGVEGIGEMGETRETGETEIAVPCSLSPSVEQQFNEAMGGLWKQYEGLMVERMEVLQKAAVAVAGGTLTVELHQSAQQQAHKLAGVLGMFELETGTQIARQIEELLAENSELLSPQKHQLRSLIQQLTDLLNLNQQPISPVSSIPNSQSPNRLLLIDPNTKFGLELQQLAQSVGMGWQQVTTLKEAKTWLQTTSPDLVVLSIEEVGWRDESLALLLDLAKRTPPIPFVVLATVDALVDRVTAARSGARGFLVKPVTAERVWDISYQILQQHQSQGTNLLVVDDDPVILATLRSMLEPWGIWMTGLENPLDFWEVLQATNPDLLILDVEMPHLNGIELCQAVRTDLNWQGLPILFLTAHRDLETVQQVFAAGADDYVVKPVVGAELMARITNRLERARLLQSFSSKDPLTGLANQFQSSRDLNNLIDRARVNCHLVCLVLLSVTELHQINIQYGHEAGNQVIQRWSRYLQSAFRGGEAIGYWGHGEFVVGISGMTKEEASDRLCDILTDLRQQIFITPEGIRYQAICHFAVVEYPNDGLTVRSLYQVASLKIGVRS
ncbi:MULTISPECIES: response regulator [Nostocales]|uniref:Multi-component transcriptional regulator n=3 Tax=Nostocales TaxID=1161 RepID=A0A0C1QZK0_9CYAN|nr:response regulator [Tolypothrix bouteillei]KAF3886932.1 response regulator [Tolypothrix bouteillei VB521301]